MNNCNIILFLLNIENTNIINNVEENNINKKLEARIKLLNSTKLFNENSEKGHNNGLYGCCVASIMIWEKIPKKAEIIKPIILLFLNDLFFILNVFLKNHL